MAEAKLSQVCLSRFVSIHVYSLPKGKKKKEEREQKKKEKEAAAKKNAEERKPKEAANKKADKARKAAEKATEKETRSNKRQKNTVSCPASKKHPLTVVNLLRINHSCDIFSSSICHHQGEKD